MNALAQLSTVMNVVSSRIIWLCCFMFFPMAMVWISVWLREGAGKPVSEKFRVTLLCFSWMATSVGMHTLNKELVTILEAPSCITSLQMCMACLVMTLFYFEKIQNVMINRPRQCLKWLIVPGAFSGMLLTSIFTYKYVTLSVMTVVRNLAPLISMPIELCVMPPNKRPGVSKGSITAMGVMLAGAVLYGFAAASDVSMIGIGFAFLNMFLAICDRMLQRRLLVQECKDMNLEACTFINNLLGMVPPIFVARMTNELSLVELHSVDWMSPGTMTLLALSGIVGLGICYCGLAVQKCISATSFLVLQNISKFAVVTVGIALFGDPIHSQFIIIGLAFSLGGSCWYGKSQIDMALSEEQKPLMQKDVTKFNIDPPLDEKAAADKAV